MSETLGDSLPQEMQRVREMIPMYESIGVSGAFAVAMMKSDLKEAEKAISENDVVKMIKVYKSLKGYSA